MFNKLLIKYEDAVAWLFDKMADLGAKYPEQIVWVGCSLVALVVLIFLPAIK